MIGDPSVRLSTGIAGFDEILQRGLIPGRPYLLRGGPGTGKTPVGLHFLTAGYPDTEKPLFITLAETEEQIRKNAGAIGFDLEGVTFLAFGRLGHDTVRRRRMSLHHVIDSCLRHLQAEIYAQDARITVSGDHICSTPTRRCLSSH